MVCRRLLQSILVVFLGLGFTVGCIPAATAPITAKATLTSESPTSTLTLVAPTEDTRWANYEDSFETVSDTSVITIPKKNSSISINKENTKTGKQSLEVRKFGSSQEFSINFWISSITGEQSLDISAKAISISVFVPKDSPVESINFAFTGGGGTVMIPVREDAGIKGRWFREAINLTAVAHNPKTTIVGSTWDAALSIIRHCEIISIVGSSSTDSKISPARFLMDDFAWSNWVEPTIDASADSLQKYAPHGLKIGTLFQDYFLLDPSFWQTVLREYNLVWIGTESGWPNDNPADPNSIDFDHTRTDGMVTVASAQHLSMKMFTGGWHSQLPQWLLDFPFNQLQPILENRVARDIGHYPGKMFMWDVFNEVTLDNGGFRNRQHKDGASVECFALYGCNYSPWVDGQDTSIIKAIFYKARATDPNAKLFLNEYGNEQIGKTKSEFFYRFVSEMKQEGVPIDGVGFQMHLYLSDTNLIGGQIPVNTYLGDVDKNVKRYEDLGLLVEFSEVEVAIRTDDLDLTTSTGRALYDQRLKRQADLYKGLMKIAKGNKNVAAFIFWDISDTWSYMIGDAALLDTYYQPKPAYVAVLNVLKEE